MIALLTSMI